MSFCEFPLLSELQWYTDHHDCITIIVVVDVVVVVSS